MNRDRRKIELIMKLRNQGIRDVRVLEAMERIPRELFVPDSFAPHAYADQAMPIACGQTISQPFIVAFMTDRLKVSKRMKVLEIGTGSGYQSAILSLLCRRVYTIERYRTLMNDAVERFRQLHLENITGMVGDGSKGWPAQAPFERIIVTAAAPEEPKILLDQLAPGGIMIVPVDTGWGGQDLLRITRATQGLETEKLLDVRFVPLVEGVARDT
ncbi:MAG: protein-L-isoaspartate(D-aspartate) O-methyltransferase [Aestuariivirgaceae bacterium]